MTTTPAAPTPRDGERAENWPSDEIYELVEKILNFKQLGNPGLISVTHANHDKAAKMLEDFVAQRVAEAVGPLVKDRDSLAALVVRLKEVLEELPELYNLATEKSCTCYPANDCGHCGFCSAWEKADNLASTASSLVPADLADKVLVRAIDAARADAARKEPPAKAHGCEVGE